MISTNFPALLLLTTTITATILIPKDYKNQQNDKLLLNNQGTESAEVILGELSDLNKKSSSTADISQFKNIANSAVEETSIPFKHHDEDMPQTQNNGEYEEESLNYDVEILESGDIKKENIEIEERFRGNGVKMNTDTFIAENIEMQAGDDIHPTHMILTVIIMLVGIVSIALYAALVIWRSHLEQRYGMRELLVNDDDDYCQQQNNMSRTAAGHYSVVQL